MCPSPDWGIPNPFLSGNSEHWTDAETLSPHAGLRPALQRGFPQGSILELETPLPGCSAGLVSTKWVFPWAVYLERLSGLLCGSEVTARGWTTAYAVVCLHVQRACSWMPLTGQSLQMNHGYFGSSGSVFWRRDLTLLFPFYNLWNSYSRKSAVKSTAKYRRVCWA